MAFVDWNDNLSVGVAEIDAEHKNLVSYVNRLSQALTVGSAPKTMEEILTGLVSYTQVHFRHEEELMSKFQYPAYAAHKKEHDDLTSQVTDFHARLQSGKTSFSLELLNFLRDWLINHIQKTDMNYRSFFREKGLS